MNVLDLGAFSTTPVRASQMSRTKTEPAIATFVDNRSIKRLVEVKNKVLTMPFSGREARPLPCSLRQIEIKLRRFFK